MKSRYDEEVFGGVETDNDSETLEQEATEEVDNNSDISTVQESTTTTTPYPIFNHFPVRFIAQDTESVSNFLYCFTLESVTVREGIVRGILHFHSAKARNNG